MTTALHQNGNIFPAQVEYTLKEDNTESFDILDVVPCLPETQQISDYTSRFFCSIINHKKQREQFFTQIILENESIFSKLTTQEKAQLLFSQYKKMVIPVIEASQGYLTPFSALRVTLSGLKCEFPEEEKLRLSVRRSIEWVIDWVNYGFSKYAIRDSLNVDFQDFSLPGESSKTVTEKLDCLTISSRTNELFQDLTKGHALE